jgi:hypothetical protein
VGWKLVGKAVLGLLFLWSFCVFGYISVVVEEGVCVRDCSGLWLCKDFIVGCSAGDECEGLSGDRLWENGRGK